MAKQCPPMVTIGLRQTAPTALTPGELLKLKHFAGMNRFRKLGFINYDVGDNLHVRSSLLNVVLHDDEGDSTASATRSRTARQKKFPSRLQSTARCSIGTVQCGRLFLEFKAIVSNAAFQVFYPASIDWSRRTVVIVSPVQRTQLWALFSSGV